MTKLYVITGWAFGSAVYPLYRHATLWERILHKLGMVGGFRWVEAKE